MSKKSYEIITLNELMGQIKQLDNLVKKNNLQQ